MKQILALTASVAVIASAAANAAPVSFPSMTTNGVATTSQTEIVLTNNGGNQAGSAWTTGYTVDASTTFSASFSFVSNGEADGITFTVQGEGPSAIGQSGGNLGYLGITDAVAVEFDTFDNGPGGRYGDPNGNHISIIDGSTVGATATPSFTIEGSATRYGWVEYDGATLSVFASDSAARPTAPILTQLIDLTDLGSVVYFGFTGGTGSDVSRQTILSFDLEVDTDAVPVPAAAFLFAPVALGAALRRRRAK
ncbi:L-type lectin-domain containing protein [Parvularcula maris]|uniref:L-type lectin-domain containing protein n=1 Tax=Parvularcula maris TaxID=2965077 RepID=A0A9X2L945_9PROT|nr:L-type lectin-domain containing protein [Parvularcula maris]MCQ8185344.1 L-type lectin-domain containing protein [Parvularcula maris]